LKELDPRLALAFNAHRTRLWSGVGPYVRETTPVTVSVTFDPARRHPDSNRGDNTLTKQLSCGGSTPKILKKPPVGL
jgi:hypothetical protein